MTGRAKRPPRRAEPRWRRYAAEVARWVRWTGFAGFVVASALVGLLLLALLPNPSAITVLAGRTEVLSFAPQNPALASILLANARVVGADRRPGPCERELELTPAVRQGTTIEVMRLAASPNVLRLRLAGEWGLAGEETNLQVGAEPVDIWLDSDDHACRAVATIRIPVDGHIGVGDETAGSEAKFLGGEVTVYGRALRQILRVPMDWGSDAGTLYEASAFSLPADARLGGLDGVGAGSQPRWLGFADVRLADEESGFDLHLATNDTSVGVAMPGTAGKSGAPDKLSITLLAQLGGDPNLQRLAGLFVLLIAILGIVAQRWPPRSSGK